MLYKQICDGITIDCNNISDTMIKASKTEAWKRLIYNLPEEELLCDSEYLCNINDALQILNGTFTLEMILRQKIIKNKQLINWTQNMSTLSLLLMVKLVKQKYHRHVFYLHWLTMIHLTIGILVHAMKDYISFKY